MTHARRPYLPRQRQPVLELPHSRPPSLGYEAPEDTGLVACLAHGFPSPLARWHFHDEYEFHIIKDTAGKAFVGDWIGPFQPGHVVLCGPRLPHNWVSMDLPEGGVAHRDLVIQFLHDPVAKAAQHVPELAEPMALLERSRHGIEFFGVAAPAEALWLRIKQSHGLQRFAAFCELLALLTRCTDYRLLSNVQIQGEDNAEDHAGINAVVDRITDEFAADLSAREMAATLGLSDSQFSRVFRRATGNTFTDFVNRIRINRACQLLMETDRMVTDICYEAGFQNVANFNRRFREIKGMTPSDFRQQADHRFGHLR